MIWVVRVSQGYQQYLNLTEYIEAPIQLPWKLWKLCVYPISSSNRPK